MQAESYSDNFKLFVPLGAEMKSIPNHAQHSRRGKEGKTRRMALTPHADARVSR